MKYMIDCLLCARKISPFPPKHPNARGFERALLCRWHFRESLDPEWFEVGPRAYWNRVEKITDEIQGNFIKTIWYTPAYFSLLLLLSNQGLLLFYPQNKSVLISYVPKRLLAKNYSSQGLFLLTEDTLYSAKGPEDKQTPKPGLIELFMANQKQSPLEKVQFDSDSSGRPTEQKLQVHFATKKILKIEATGYVSILQSPVDVSDLRLTWETNP